VLKPVSDIVGELPEKVRVLLVVLKRLLYLVVRVDNSGG
jgi:hypothetical protein